MSPENQIAKEKAKCLLLGIPWLPEGIMTTADGYIAQCRGCHEWGALPCDITEIPETGYQHYCGGSPWCCP